MKRLSIKDVRSSLKSQGLKLVGEYINCYTPTEVKCLKCKYTWKPKIQDIRHSKTGCPACYQKRRKRSKKEIRETLAGRGITITSKFETVNDNADFKCEEGHTWNTQVMSVLRGCGCSKCHTNSRQLDIKEVKKRLQSSGLKLLKHKRVPRSNGIGTYLKIKTECLICNHIGISKYHKNISCQKCGRERTRQARKLTHKEVAKWFKENGIILLSKYKGCYKPLEVRCETCDHEWTTNWNRAKYNNRRCPQCGLRSMAKTKKLSTKEIKIRLNKIGFTLISKYKGMKKKGNVIQCNKCKMQRTGRMTDLLSYGCPICSIGTFENYIVELCTKILKKKFGKVQRKRQKTFPDLLSDKGYPLRFDVAFKLPDNRILCVEAQGEQHYDKNHFHHQRHEDPEESWKSLKRSDAMKKEFCKDSGILLLRVPFFAKPKQIERKIIAMI